MDRTKQGSIQPKKGMPRLLELAMINKPLMAGAIILTILATTASFLPYLAIYFIIREIMAVYPDFSLLDVSRIIGFGSLALGGVFINVLLYTLANALSHVAAYGTLYQLKMDFITHIARLPLGYHLNTGSGTLRKIMDDNIESLEGFIAHDLTNMISAFTAPVVMLVMVIAVDFRFGITTLAGIVLSFVIYKVTSGGDKTKQMMGEYQNALEDMAGASVEYIRGISVVKAFGQTTFSFKRLFDSIKRYTATVIPYSLSQEMMMASFSTMLGSIYLFLIPVGILLGQRTANYMDFASSFVFYLIFVPAIASILMKVLYASVNAMQVGSAVERVDQIMTQPVLPEGELTQQPHHYDVEFEQVSFSYMDQKASSALTDISFAARQGEVTAIVGSSGGGKSTVANLIPRFYDVDSGVIKIGGVDIRDFRFDYLMDTVSFVFQDNFLFKQSILENIRMGRLDASEDEVIRAAKAARCHEFIAALPEGYHTVLGKSGIKFSGGEIQRITIARALVKDAPILVLDEATSFSDPENEHLIQQALGELMKGKTVIMIAHRLSTVQEADQILVMEHGRLIETGKHNELLAKQGKYAVLWDNYTKALNWKLAKEA